MKVFGNYQKGVCIKCCWEKEVTSGQRPARPPGCFILSRQQFKDISLYIVKAVTAVLHLVTWDSTLAGHLGDHLKQWNHQQETQKFENMVPERVWKGHFLQCESWNRKAVSPRSSSAGYLYLRWHIFHLSGWVCQPPWRLWEHWCWRDK